MVCYQDQMLNHYSIKVLVKRVDVVTYSAAERPFSGAGIINNRCNYVTFDGFNDRMQCNMNLNISSRDKTLSITVVYRMTAYGTGIGLKMLSLEVIILDGIVLFL